IAKARALLHLPPHSRERGRKEAKELIDTTLSYAREKNILGAQTELLNQAALIAIEEGEHKRAEELFQETVRVDERANLPRKKAAALPQLSRSDRETKQLSKADHSVEAAIAAIQQAEQAYDLPLYIAEKAEVRAALGSLEEADTLHAQALDLIEGLLVN